MGPEMARLLVAATIGFSLFVAGLSPALAQSKVRKAAEESLRLGLVAQKSRKHDAAITRFSLAINSGGLARKQMTYALYRRAVSHRAAKRPAQAISDLYSSVFFKGYLSTSDRAAAVKERARAYKDAGLKPTTVATAVPQAMNLPSGPTTPKKPSGKVQPRQSLSSLPLTAPILGGPEPKQVRQPKQVRRVQPVPATSQTTSPSPSAFRTRVSQAVRQPVNVRRTRTEAPAASWGGATTTKAAPGSNAATRTSAWSSTNIKTKPTRSVSNGGAPPQRVTVSAAKSKAAPQGTARQENGVPASSSVAGFFSNLFGASQSNTNKMWKPIGKKEASETRGSAAVRPASNGWASTSGPVVTGATPKVRVARAQPVAQTKPVKSRASVVRTPAEPGAFDIAVAAVRSPASARALAKRLNAKYAGSESWIGKQARVDMLPPTASRGVLYSVKLGVYTSRGALASQCEKLIADGLECQVIRRD